MTFTSEYCKFYVYIFQYENSIDMERPEPVQDLFDTDQEFFGHIVRATPHIDGFLLDFYGKSGSFVMVIEGPQPLQDLFDYITPHTHKIYFIDFDCGAFLKQDTLYTYFDGFPLDFYGKSGSFVMVIERPQPLQDLFDYITPHTHKIYFIDFDCGAFLKQDTLYTYFDGFPLDFYEKSGSSVMVIERPQPLHDLFDYITPHIHTTGVVDENILINMNTHKIYFIDFGCGAFLKDFNTDFNGEYFNNP